MAKSCVTVTARSFATAKPAGGTQAGTIRGAPTVADSFATATPAGRTSGGPGYADSFATAKPAPRHMAPTVASGGVGYADVSESSDLHTLVHGQPRWLCFAQCQSASVDGVHRLALVSVQDRIGMTHAADVIVWIAELCHGQAGTRFHGAHCGWRRLC